MRDRLNVTGFVLWLSSNGDFGDHSSSLDDLSHGDQLVTNSESDRFDPRSHPEKLSDPHAVFDQSVYLEAGDAGFSIFCRWSPSFSSSQVPLSPDPGSVPGLIASGYTIYSNSDA